METLSAQPVGPQTQISNMRQQSISRIAAPQPTRQMRAAENGHPQPPSAPASQESKISVQSTGSSVQPLLQSSSSNVSQLTKYTDPNPPDVHSLSTYQNGKNGFSHAYATAHVLKTPEERGEEAADYMLASPMSVASPPTGHAAKRTANGHVKNAPSQPSTPMNTTASGRRRSRAESMSSTSSRAADLAATLRSRLGYAMAKVQHGWEHKNIIEVEQLAVHKMSPNRHSMSHAADLDRRPLSAGLSNGTARLSMYETYPTAYVDSSAAPPFKRRSGTYNTILASSGYPAAPHLQPAPDLRPMSTAYSHPSQKHQYATAMSPPSTPQYVPPPRRLPTIRTDTQTREAERDALQALFELGSPRTSLPPRHTNNASQASSSQASPLRHEFPTPRRVTFAHSESDSSDRASSAEGSLPET